MNLMISKVSWESISGNAQFYKVSKEFQEILEMKVRLCFVYKVSMDFMNFHGFHPRGEGFQELFGAVKNLYKDF